MINMKDISYALIKIKWSLTFKATYINGIAFHKNIYRLFPLHCSHQRMNLKKH